MTGSKRENDEAANVARQVFVLDSFMTVSIQMM